MKSAYRCAGLIHCSLNRNMTISPFTLRISAQKKTNSLGSLPGREDRSIVMGDIKTLHGAWAKSLTPS